MVHLSFHVVHLRERRDFAARDRWCRSHATPRGPSHTRAVAQGTGQGDGQCVRVRAASRAYNLPTMALFHALAHTSLLVAGTRKKTEKAALLRDLLVSLEKDEIGAAAGWLAAEPPCGAIGLGYSALYQLTKLPAATEPTMTILEVGEALTKIKGASKKGAQALARALFERLTHEERRFLVGALTYTLRQGGLAGVLLSALTLASGREEAEVRRAATVLGTTARVAEAVLGAAREHPLPTSISLLTPLAPMLASPTEGLHEAWETMRGGSSTQEAAPEKVRVEWKVDGVRAQVHVSDGLTRVFSRQGNDITEAAEPALRGAIHTTVGSVVLDCEIALVNDELRARPFQETFSALSGGPLPEGYRLHLFAFDCLHQDGRDLTDLPLRERLAALRATVVLGGQMPAIETDDESEAKAFFTDAEARGHEGVMLKALSAPYRLGSRGEAWLKVKRVHTFDLVVLAVEWGSGRRKGMLSNIHLGARAEDGTFVMVGKTFKGMTDELLAWQTRHFQEIESRRDAHVVYVRPETVVEVEVGDVQKSPRYPGHVALRFARVVRYREDKRPEEADLLATLQKLADVPPAHPPKPVVKAEKKQLSLFEGT